MYLKIKFLKKVEHNQNSGPAMIVKKQGIAFFKAGNKWNLAENGGVVMGYVIHKGKLEIEKRL